MHAMHLFTGIHHRCDKWRKYTEISLNSRTPQAPPEASWPPATAPPPLPGLPLEFDNFISNPTPVFKQTVQWLTDAPDTSVCQILLLTSDKFRPVPARLVNLFSSIFNFAELWFIDVIFRSVPCGWLLIVFDFLWMNNCAVYDLEGLRACDSSPSWFRLIM